MVDGGPVPMAGTPSTAFSPHPILIDACSAMTMAPDPLRSGLLEPDRRGSFCAGNGSDIICQMI